MRNPYACILLSLFRRRLFWGAMLFPLFPLVLVDATIFMVTPSGFNERLIPFLDISGLAMLGLALSFVLGTHLKSLVATPIGAMLPGGRVKPFLVIYSLALVLLVVSMAVGMRPNTDIGGLFSIILVSMGVALLVGYWQGPYVALLCWIPLVSNTLAKNIPFLRVIDGGYSGYAGAYMLLGFAFLTFLAYRVLTLDEEKREYKWNRYTNPSGATETGAWAQRSVFSRIIRERNYRGIRYESLKPLERFIHLRGFGQGLLSAPIILGIVAFGLVMTWIQGRSGLNAAFPFIMWIYLLAVIAPLGLLQQRWTFASLECALPLSRARYVRDMGGMILVATFGMWLNAAIAAVLGVTIVHPTELLQSVIWTHIVLSACLAFLCTGVACLASYYAGKNAAMIMVVILVLLQATVIPLSIGGSFARINTVACVIIVGISLIIGSFMLKIAYRKWVGVDMAGQI